jgi:hypothetical protein
VIDFQGARVIHAQQPELGAIDSVVSLKRWRDKLVQLCGAVARIGGCPIGSLANELAGHSENHRRALAVHFEHWGALIEDGLLRMQAKGRLRPSLNPKTLSIAFLTAIEGGFLFAKLHGSSGALATALDEIIRSIELDPRKLRPPRQRSPKGAGAR